MFSSIYLMVLLLVNIVQIGSTIEIPPGCDLSKKPSVKNFDVSRYAGTWYLREMTAPFPDQANLTSYEVDVTYVINGTRTILNILTKASYIGQTVCIKQSFPCVMNGSTCIAPGIEDNYELIAIDYKSSCAIWSKFSDTYQLLSLYTRDAFSPPDISGIQSQLKNFCGAPATDPTSSFYAKKFDYKNSPCIV